MDELTEPDWNIDNAVYDAEILIERRHADALRLTNEIVANAVRSGDVHYMVKADYILAHYYCLVANDYDKAIELCETALKRKNDGAVEAVDYKLFMTLGNAYRLKGELFSSQVWYMKGLRQLEQQGELAVKDKNLLASFYYNLAILFTNTELNNSGEDYLQRAIQLYEDVHADFKLSLCYSAYANIFEGRGEYHKAIELMDKALKLDIPRNDQYSIALSKANIGILYSRIDIFEPAIAQLQDALNYFEHEGMMHESALVKLNLGRVLCSASQHEKGIAVLMDAERIFGKLENKHELTNVFQQLSDALYKTSDYKAALEYHRKYVDGLKLVFDGEKTNAVTRARQEFETEQKEKETALLREKNAEIQIYAASLEAANNDLESLSYSVSHDLKAPLAMIKNINSMVEADVDECRKYIDKTCKEALASIDNILSYSKAINKGAQTGYEIENVYDVISQKAEELKPIAAANAQNLVFVQPDTTLTGRMNKEAIGRVIANLIGNSIKFSNATGEINIRVYREDKDWYIIRISDEGIGIPAELHHSLFEKFSASQRTGLHGEKSTGLGLYITHSIIKLHGGQIEFDSAVNKGTTFIIRLPIAGTR